MAAKKKTTLYVLSYRLEDSKVDTQSEPLNKEASEIVKSRIEALGYTVKVKEVKV